MSTDVARSSPKSQTTPPKGWERVRLGDILKLRKEVVHPRDKPQGQARFVGLEHIESNTGLRKGHLDLDLSRLTGRKPRYYQGDIVYGYLRPYLNKVWVAEFDGLCSVDQYVYQIETDQADRQFVAWFMRSPVFLRRAPVGTTPGQLPRIRTDEVASVEIDLPSLPEQQRIAAALTEQLADVQRARLAAEARLAAAEALPAAYLRHVFEDEQARIWRRYSLGEVSAIAGGVQKSPDRAPVKLHRPYLTVRNVQRGRLDLSHVERFEVTATDLERLRLEDRDLLVVEGNGSLEHIGRCALFAADGEEWVHQNHVIRVRLDRRVMLPEFVEAYLTSPPGRVQMVEKAKTTSGLYTLSTGKVGSLAIPAPSLPEQRRAVAALQGKLSACVRLRAALEAELGALRALPAALLRQAFSGAL